MMRTKIQAIVLSTGLLVSLAAVPVYAQEAEHSKMGQMHGTKMTDEEKKAKIEKMSTDDKAAAVDQMSEKDKAAATKTSGQDVNKMSAQEKADMYDKMPMDKKMSMMSDGSMMHKGGKMGKGKMGKMGGMGKTEKP